ncbi:MULTISPECIES: rRNA pseudouridine synthase [unclassified Lysobacter]|uniref:rRNA pseudouridine synthase n=1 Tax=unclassified Lysobacter TaxID=2635362 RepID=UPI001BE837D9|nr:MULTISPECIES: rRNA pseudouridine synthase [unclassified Lysobacter]MBT2747724.1 rRNA pseudouridine synthase [Lysobacter sp. ISL-42]MBT2754042.1 rRNA pseudouridine synthase [Lysobacter sp. ISL-50]MBT2779679.1 rRNA pseudouridine synthase [Lysobacter sp. ISL-54]MBT2780142.1 rRNA pseudouridine synthase [Lysobacter sp. ISL-52]
MSEPLRLDKRVAELAGCSRAQAQQYIEGGWVRVDGEVVEEPQAPVSTEQVELDPQARLEPAEPATVLLHKPAGVDFMDIPGLVVAAARAEGDVSGVRLLKRHFHRLTPLMPIDAEASGLVVLSQDGRIWRRLTEDYAQIEQEFVVEVSGELGPYGLKRLAHGLEYRGRPLAPCKVSWQNETRLRFAIKNPQGGQLRHMCAQVGLQVVSSKRLRIGRISLSKMPVGQWRYLPVGERF